MDRGQKENLSDTVSTVRLDDLQQAINDLTTADLIRLQKYAWWRVRGLGRKCRDRNHEDLLCEAISATLQGKRQWNRKNVDFVGHLLGTMYSISSNWGKQFKDEEFFFDFDDAKNFSESSYLPSQEEKIFAKQMEDKINRLFEDDPLVTIIICELKDGSKLREIREKYKISDNDYEAAMKRMRRKLTRLYEGDEHV